MKGAQVRVVYLDPAPNGAKVGLDDYLAAGGNVAGLLARAEDDVRPAPHGEGDDGGPYIATPAGFVYRSGSGDQPLSNFTARITEEVIADDGASQRGELVIAGTLGDETLPSLRVPARRFATLDWVSEWGARTILAAGFGNRDRLREAIQRLSPDIERRHEFEHPGWRELPGHGWCYLHAGGAIGAAGAVAGVDVALREPASRLLLPVPPQGDELRAAVRACLGLRDLAPDRVTVPLFGAVYRAMLCEVSPADLSVFLVGTTGVFKTELGALAMQHVGASFDRLHLPAQWSSTANSLERMAFDLKDAPFVVDDFAPHGTQSDVARLHATADRLLRGVGNRGGRSRMRSDGTLRPDLPPRGLVIATGEDAPRGQSLRARLVLIDVAADDVDRAQLTAAQAAARTGTYAAAMAGFVQWLASQFGTLLGDLPARLGDFRAQAHGAGPHARTPGVVAQLATGWWSFLRFAADVGALTQAEAEAAFERAWQALGETAARQTDYQTGEEPARHFLDLLTSALAAGEAHFASMDGREPSSPQAWGWRSVTVGAGEYERIEWRPQGKRAGWLDGDNLYLDLGAALTAVQRVGQATGGGVPVTPTTLAKRLHGQGFLRSIERAGELHVRRTIEGQRRRVLHLAPSAIISEESRQSRQSRHAAAESAQPRADEPSNGGVPWWDSAAKGDESRHTIPPEQAPPCANGGIGGIGGVFLTHHPSQGERDGPAPRKTEREHDPAVNAPADCPRPWQCGTHGPCPGYDHACPLAAPQGEAPSWCALPLSRAAS
jgi:hypothetical protein